MNRDPVLAIELERLYRRYRESPDSHVFAPLADACRKAGKLDEAIEICRKGVEKHSDYASGWVVLGKCLYDSEDLEGARSAFERVRDLDGENLVALKYLGTIAARCGDPDQARIYFDKILALDPENEEIGRMLRDLEGEEIIELKPIEGEDFEGEEIALGREEVETSDELATVTLADIFARQGYRGKAIKILQELLAHNPENEAAKSKLRALTEGEPVAGNRSEEDRDERPREEPREDRPARGRGRTSASSSSAARGGEGSRGRSSRAKRSGRGGGKAPRARDIDGEGLEQFKKWLENSGR